MSTLYMMVGIPASGKSTKTAELIRKGAIAISSDTIREEIFGDANITYTEKWLAEQGYDGAQDNSSKEFFANARIFDIVYRKCSERLLAGQDVIIDSTSCNKKARQVALENIKNADRRVCIVMAVSFRTCCIRNKMRDRVVPDDAMRRIADHFEFPSEEEGFDKIIYIGNREDIDYGKEVS